MVAEHRQLLLDLLPRVVANRYRSRYGYAHNPENEYASGVRLPTALQVLQVRIALCSGFGCVTWSQPSPQCSTTAAKRSSRPRVQAVGKHVFLGSFDTAKEGAVAYARTEYGRADAAKLLQPRCGAEAIRQAEREGLSLATSSNSTGYKGVTFYPKREKAARPRLLRHRRAGGALLRPQGVRHGHARQRSHCDAAAAAAVLNLCGAASVRAQHSDA